MRRRRTPQQREAICVAHDWVCGLCAVRIDPVREKLALDHIIPLTDVRDDASAARDAARNAVAGRRAPA